MATVEDTGNDSRPALGERVLVVGCGGAGKTTLAIEIADRTGLPLVHLDRLYWRPGWEPTPDAEWDRLVERLVAAERWVMDGNYGRTLPRRLAACDSVVFLDLPRAVCLARALRRQWSHRGRSRPEMPDGCPERFSFEFLRWIWTYRARRRPEMLRRLAAFAATKRVVILRDAAAVRRFVSSLESAAR